MPKANKWLEVDISGQPVARNGQKAAIGGRDFTGGQKWPERARGGQKRPKACRWLPAGIVASNEAL